MQTQGLKNVTFNHKFGQGWRLLMKGWKAKRAESRCPYNEALQILYYPEHSDHMTSPGRNATKMPRVGVVGSDAHAKTNSLIVVHIPQ